MNAMRRYIRVVDGFNYGLGRIMMYGIFVLMGILLWSSYNKTFASPQIWTLEMAQFVMVGYYILGGPYALQMGANVRMDLFYAELTPRKKAWTDCITVFFLLIYLVILLWGGIESTMYSFKYGGERRNHRDKADRPEHPLPSQQHQHHGRKHQDGDQLIGHRGSPLPI